jgi:hypothetical protein
MVYSFVTIWRRLLNTFQSTLDEVTIIALPEQNGTADAAAVQKAVKIQSFYDPAKGEQAFVIHISDCAWQ